MSAPHHSPLSFAVFPFPVFFSLPLGVFPTLCTTFFSLSFFKISGGLCLCVSLGLSLVSPQTPFRDSIFVQPSIQTEHV